MSRLVILIIFAFFVASAAFADIDFNENIYSNLEKPVTKISDLGVTVATNEKDFKLVLKRNDPPKPVVKAVKKTIAKPVVKASAKTKTKKSSVKAEKKNPLNRRIASSVKRVQKKTSKSGK